MSIVAESPLHLVAGPGLPTRTLSPLTPLHSNPLTFEHAVSLSLLVARSLRHWSEVQRAAKQARLQKVPLGTPSTSSQSVPSLGPSEQLAAGESSQNLAPPLVDTSTSNWLLTRVSKEIFYEIFGYLNGGDIESWRQTNKTWRRVISKNPRLMKIIVMYKARYTPLPPQQILQNRDQYPDADEFARLVEESVTNWRALRVEWDNIAPPGLDSAWMCHDDADGVLAIASGGRASIVQLDSQLRGVEQTTVVQHDIGGMRPEVIRVCPELDLMVLVELEPGRDIFYGPPIPAPSWNASIHFCTLSTGERHPLAGEHVVKVDDVLSNWITAEIVGEMIVFSYLAVCEDKPGSGVVFANWRTGKRLAHHAVPSRAYCMTPVFLTHDLVVLPYFPYAHAGIGVTRVDGTDWYAVEELGVFQLLAQGLVLVCRFTLRDQTKGAHISRLQMRASPLSVLPPTYLSDAGSEFPSTAKCQYNPPLFKADDETRVFVVKSDILLYNDDTLPGFLPDSRQTIQLTVSIPRFLELVRPHTNRTGVIPSFTPLEWCPHAVSTDKYVLPGSIDEDLEPASDYPRCMPGVYGARTFEWEKTRGNGTSKSRVVQDLVLKEHLRPAPSSESSPRPPATPQTLGNAPVSPSPPPPYLTPDAWNETLGLQQTEHSELLSRSLHRPDTPLGHYSSCPRKQTQDIYNLPVLEVQRHFPDVTAGEIRRSRVLHLSLDLEHVILLVQHEGPYGRRVFWMVGTIASDSKAES